MNDELTAVVAGSATPEQRNRLRSACLAVRDASPTPIVKGLAAYLGPFLGFIAACVFSTF